MRSLASVLVLVVLRSAPTAAFGVLSDAPNSARKLAGATTTAEAASTGQRIHYDWSQSALTDPRRDALRYKAQIDALLASPMSSWEVVQKADTGAIQAARPIRVDGQEYAVSYYQADFNLAGGREFFELLATPEGSQLVIDPQSNDTPESRAEAEKFRAPWGTEGRVEALKTKVRPSLGGKRIVTSASFYRHCHPRAQTLYNIPAIVPVSERSAAMQPFGTTLDLSILHAHRVTQVSRSTVRMSGVLWFPLLPGRASVFLGVAFWDGVDERMRHLFDTREFPATRYSAWKCHRHYTWPLRRFGRHAPH